MQPFTSSNNTADGPYVVLRRYERGQIQTDDPEEEKKQKEFKSLLNKLTPEKYETIRNKLLAVGIEQAITLQGLIDQASILLFLALNPRKPCHVHVQRTLDLHLPRGREHLE